MNEIDKVKAFIKDNPNYKVADIQRLLKKGFIYCSKLLESIGER
jgi:hypothetical protein